MAAVRNNSRFDRNTGANDARLSPVASFVATAGAASGLAVDLSEFFDIEQEHVASTKLKIISATTGL